MLEAMHRGNKDGETKNIIAPNLRNNDAVTPSMKLEVIIAIMKLKKLMT